MTELRPKILWVEGCLVKNAEYVEHNGTHNRESVGLVNLICSRSDLSFSKLSNRVTKLTKNRTRVSSECNTLRRLAHVPRLALKLNQLHGGCTEKYFCEEWGSLKGAMRVNAVRNYRTKTTWWLRESLVPDNEPDLSNGWMYIRFADTGKFNGVELPDAGK